MVLKYFIFFLLIIFLSIFAIINDNIDFSKFDFKYTAYATMRFTDVESSHIISSGVNREVEASSVIRYDDVDYIKNIKVYLEKEDSIENLESNIAINYKKFNKSRENGLVEKQVFFKENVIYKRDNNFTLRSDDLIYDIKNKIIKSNSDFILTEGDNKVVGSSFLYDLTTKEIKAKDINTTIYIDEEQK